MGSRLKQQRGGRRGGQSIKEEEEEGKGKQCEEEEEEASGPRGEASKWESPHHHVAGSRGLCWRRPNPPTSSSFPPRPLRYFFLYSLHSFRRRRSRRERERREQRQSSQVGARRGGGGGRSFRSVYRSGSRRRCGAPCEPRRGARRTWAGGPCGGGGGGVGCFVGMERAVLPAADGDGGI